MKATQRLRQLLASRSIQVAPGVFDGLSALLAEQMQFSLIYASGGAIARSCGYPDLGLLSLHEVLNRVEQIAEVSHLPIIADADTGFGNSINVQRTTRLFERAGVAAFHLEDQEFPKRCGHLNNKSLISRDEMVQKIKVARDTLQDDDFVLIARTDAIAVEGFSSAIKRAQAYLTAGADMIFVEAPETIEQIERIAAEITAPKLINMFYGGKTPLIPLLRLQEMGYALVIIPSDLQRAAIFAMQQALTAIYKNGDSTSLSKQLTGFEEREVIIATERYLQLDNKKL